MTDIHEMPPPTGRDRAQSEPASHSHRSSVRNRLSLFARRSRSRSRDAARNSSGGDGDNRGSLSERLSARWSMVSRRRSSAVEWLAAIKERWDEKEQAFVVLRDYHTRQAEVVDSLLASWSALLGVEGPGGRAPSTAASVTATLHAAEKAEEGYAVEISRLSVRALHDLSDELAPPTSPMAALSTAAKANSERSVRAASDARERALRLSQARGHLAAVEASVASEVRDLTRTLQRAHAALTRQQVQVGVAYDELRHAFEAEAKRHAATTELDASWGGGGGADLWQPAHLFLRAAAAQRAEAEAQAAAMAATRAALLQAAERLWSCASAAVAPPLDDSERAPASAAAPLPVSDSPVSVPWQESVWPLPQNAALPLVPANPYTRRSGACTRLRDGVLRTSHLSEWAVLTLDRTLHLFDYGGGGEGHAEAAGVAVHLQPAKPVLTLDCSDGPLGATARAWTPDAADQGLYSTLLFNTSSRVLLSVPPAANRSPVTQRLWAATLGRAASATVGGGGGGPVEHDLNFGTPVQAEEWLAALGGHVELRDR